MDPIKILADGISSIGVHNGVVRIEFMQLGVNGKPATCLELHVPVVQMRQIADALKKAAG